MSEKVVQEEVVNHSITQKKIAFANSEHLEAVLAILRECSGVPQLIADTSHKTVVNAATLDAQSNMINKFINTIDFIKKGGLLTTEK